MATGATQTSIVGGVRTRPFYFGRDRRLFGLYESPVDESEECGVVLCSPVVHEYVRSHRACRQLALRLVRLGCGVLRFDYFGCGDSDGESDEVLLEEWVADVRAAIDHVRARCRKVYLIGLRLGASLGWLAEAGRRNLDGLVLWQPVVTGTPLLDEWRAQQESHEKKFFSPASSPRSSGIDTFEVLGFRLSQSMVGAIESLDLCAVSAPLTRRTLLLRNLPGADLDPLCERLEPTGGRLDQEFVHESRLWSGDPDELVIPLASIKSVVDWLSGVVHD